MRRGTTRITLAILAAAATGAALPAAASDYALHWDAAKFPAVDVVAHLRSATCTFGTSDHWADFFDDKRGWSRFIANVHAFARGAELPVQATETGTWRIGDGKACAIELHYSVDFSFGQKQWEPGNEQVAYTDGKAVYTTGLPLFVLDDDSGPATVRIDAPRGWQIATPWTPSGAREFRARNRDALLSNTFVIGDAAVSNFHAGNFNVILALLGNLNGSADLVAQTFSRIVPNYVRMFGDAEPGRFMVALIPGPEDGESFTDSFAVATTEAPNPLNKIIWANHLAHELLHYWMGGKLAAAAADEDSLQWFTEGVTEYLANRALMDEGIYTEDQFLARMGRHMGAYIMTRTNPNFMKITPAQSGAHKWQNRPLVYSGGATIAFCLDGRIRSASGGKHTIRDMLHGLFARRAHDGHLTLAAIEAEASAAAGQNLDDFFKRYVEGTETLPLKECATAFGLVARDQDHDVFLSRQ